MWLIGPLMNCWRDAADRCVSEYGAPEDSELKKQTPFAIRNHLLSQSRLSLLLPLSDWLTAVSDILSVIQRSRLCFLMTLTGRRSRRNFQVTQQHAVSCRVSDTGSHLFVSSAASMLVQKVKTLLNRLLKVPAAELRLSYTSDKVIADGS